MSESRARRLFFAIDPDAESRECIARVQHEFRSRVGGGRWTSPDSYHLTLKFLGNVEESRIPEVQAAASAVVAHFGEMDVELRGAGCFPSVQRPQVLWVGIAPNEELSRLAGELDAAMERSGFARESRAFSPHITLARFKERVAGMAEVCSDLGSSGAALSRFRAREMILYESRTLREGAQYTAISRVQLTS